jgi:hypothetical protein
MIIVEKFLTYILLQKHVILPNCRFLCLKHFVLDSGDDHCTVEGFVVSKWPGNSVLFPGHELVFHVRIGSHRFSDEVIGGIITGF